MRKTHSESFATRLVCTTLDDRIAPAIFTVTTVVDNGNDTTPTAGSLRAAIINANNTAGADSIVFNIPGGGVQSIQPTTQLPAITDTVTLDGTSQPGYQSSSGGPPVIRINGSSAGSQANGLRILNHTGTVIKAFTISGFGGAGILIQGGGSHKILGDQIGTSQNGTALEANAIGISITNSTSVQVGGTNTGERNIISGNNTDGVQIQGSTGTIVSNNYIGTDINGLNALPNSGFGVNIFGGSINSLIGGTAAGSGNVISGNVGSGVRISDATTGGNNILGNRIGLSFSGTGLANKSDGIRVENNAGTSAIFTSPTAAATIIRSNTISGNSGNGVAVKTGSRYVTIDNNNMSANSLQGIEVDANAQNGILPPTLTNVTTKIGEVDLNGTFKGKPSTAYTVTIYGSSVNDPQGIEGQQQLGTISVTTGTDGSGTILYAIPSNSFGGFLSATITDSTTGETSAFSNGLSKGTASSTAVFAVGTGSGSPIASIFNSAGQAISSNTVFDSTVTGGVRVASADFNGDGVLDVVVGTGPGVQAKVRVLDGKTNNELFSLTPFDNFTGGVFVATGDMNKDGIPDFVVTPDQGGGPRVRMFSGKDFAQINDFFGIQDPNFRGGARASIGDVNGDGFGDLIVSAGYGGGPRIAGYDGRSVVSGAALPSSIFGDFFAFEDTLRNGAYVAVGDINGDGKADLIFGAGPGGGPRVTILSGSDIITNKKTVISDFFAGNTSNRGGIRVAAKAFTQNGQANVITGDGPGGSSAVQVYIPGTLIASPSNPTSALTLNVFTDSTDGVYVG